MFFVQEKKTIYIKSKGKIQFKLQLQRSLQLIKMLLRNMSIDSDSYLLYYGTTYSEDERIEKALQKERNVRELGAKKEDLERRQKFENLMSQQELNIFNLPGLKFHTFRHLKLKFSFQPSQLTDYVITKVIFYVSLRYRDNHWRIKRDTLPANYKWKIYKLFYDQSSFTVDDENIVNVLLKIYEVLVAWADNEENFRLKKFERYKKNEDVVLDSDDEQIFLTQQERIQRFIKKSNVLGRMIPPNKRN